MPASYLLQADARALPLADASVQSVVTSPPYWGLRDYGLPPAVWGGEDHVHQWGPVGPAHHPGQVQDGKAVTRENAIGQNAGSGQWCTCGAWCGVLGLEPTPELYVSHMVAVFREVRRVLRDDGTVWLNLGDSYAGSWGNQGRKPERGTQRPINGPMLQSLAGQYPAKESNTGAVPDGLKPKDLVGVPWRVAFALQADGWWLRSDVIWSKPNPMPESITDRPTKAHEYLFLLTKRERYFYDAEAVKEAANSEGPRGGNLLNDTPKGPNGGNVRWKGERALDWATTGRNRRSVWTIATEPYPEAHFATFPEKLVEPCILAGTSERGACPTCGAPWAREVERERTFESGSGRSGNMPQGKNGAGMQGGGATLDVRRGPTVHATTTGWSPSCACPPRDPVPCRVLDPFAGSGTTVAVAERLGRVGIGVELKPDYLRLARRRTVQAGLL